MILRDWISIFDWKWMHHSFCLNVEDIFRCLFWRCRLWNISAFVWQWGFPSSRISWVMTSGTFLKRKVNVLTGVILVHFKEFHCRFRSKLTSELLWDISEESSKLFWWYAWVIALLYLVPFLLMMVDELKDGTDSWG